MPLFEVAILELPKNKDAEEGALEKIILPPTTVLATDLENAAIIAVMDNAEVAGKVDRQRMQVLARPFV